MKNRVKTQYYAHLGAFIPLHLWLRFVQNSSYVAGSCPKERPSGRASVAMSRMS